MSLIQSIPISFIYQKAAPRIDVVQQDTARYLRCDFIDYKSNEGFICELMAKNHFGELMYSDGEVHENYAIVKLTEDMLSRAGIIHCQLKLLSGDNQITSLLFNVNVTKALE